MARPAHALSHSVAQDEGLHETDFFSPLEGLEVERIELGKVKQDTSSDSSSSSSHQ